MMFRTLLDQPRKLPFRNLIFQLHLYTGLGVGLLACVAGLTGSILVFKPAIERSGSPVVERPAPDSEPLPMSELVHRAANRWSSLLLVDIRLPDKVSAPVEFHLHDEKTIPVARDAKPRPRRDLFVYLDPFTGEELGNRPHKRSAFLESVTKLHHDLWAGRTGRLINGVGALFLLSLCLSGLFVWWPGRTLWRKRLTLHGGVRWKRCNWDLHNAAGFWFAGFLGLQALTGAAFTWPDSFRSAVLWVTASDPLPEKHKRSNADEGRRLAPADTWQIAELSDKVLQQSASLAPNASAVKVKIPGRHGEPVKVRLNERGDMRDDGNSELEFSALDGSLTRANLFQNRSFGQKVATSFEHLHFGRMADSAWIAVPMKALWIVLGLIPGILFVSGILMWWNRVASKALHRKAAPVQRRRRKVEASIAASLLLLAAQPGFGAVGVIEGTVLDPAGAVVPSATVRLRQEDGPATRFVTTDRSGSFRIDQVPAGRYVITAMLGGFTPAMETFKFAAGENVQGIVLRLDLDTAHTVMTVEAGSPEETRLDDPVPQSGSDRSVFEFRNNRRIGDVVQRLPGIYMTGPPGNNKDVRMRGMDKEFTRTQLDGVMLPDGGEKRELQLDRIPAFMIEDVRVIRNPTAEYESDGIAGRIDLQTRPIPEQLQMEARAAYGARGDLDKDMAHGSFSAGWQFHQRVGVFGTVDYLNDVTGGPKNKTFSSGRLESEDEFKRNQSPNAYFNLGIRSGWGSWHVKPMFFRLGEDRDRQKQVIDGLPQNRELEGELKVKAMRGTMLSHRLDRPSGVVWQTTGGYFRTSEDRDKQKLSYKYKASAFALDKTTNELEDKADATWNLQSSLAVPFRAAVFHELKFGVSTRFRDRFRDKLILEVDKNGKEKDKTGPKDGYFLAENYTAFFAQDRLRVTPKLSFTPGLRFERVTLRARAKTGPEQTSEFVDWNPSGHLMYRVRGNLTVRAAVSRGLNRPKFDELSPFEQERPTSLLIGNPGLQPARSWNFDGGAEYLAHRWFLGVNFFHRRIQGVIEEVDTGENRGVLDVFQVLNVGDGWTRGVEIEQRFSLAGLRSGPLRDLNLWSNQTLLSSELREASGAVRQFKDQPRWIANLGLDYVREGSGTVITVSSNLVGARRELKPNGDEKTIAAAYDLDSSIHQPIFRNLALFVEGSNLLNRRRTEREVFANGLLGHRSEFLGRTILFGVRWSLR